ncbi:hypothetical protein MMC14_003469 [Varicellaria rhodocarpa]|nr:hypothetical protein [Varicellaria rhodocarpa]
MHPTFICSLLLAATTVSIAFQHSPGDKDGVYVHIIDKNGNPVTTYIGPPNATELQKILHKPTIRSEDVDPETLNHLQRRKKQVGPSGNNGPNCVAEVTGDPDDFLAAEQIMGYACSTVSKFYHAISSVYLGSVAYGCDYTSNYQGSLCDQTSLTDQNAAVDIQCGNNTAGWWTDKGNWYAAGRTNVGVQFCW